MKNILIICSVASALVGLGAGYILFAPPTTNEGTEEDMRQDMGAVAQHMPHPMLEADPARPPAVSLQVLKDAKDGYNIRIITTNYTWAPEHVNETPVQGEGHAHIYVNGVKVARVYGEWFHLSADKLREGENTLEVTLNANEHSEWASNGQHISATAALAK